MLSGCAFMPHGEPAASRRRAAAQRLAAEQQRCRQHWQQLEPLLLRVQEQRHRLAAVEAEGYVPGAGRPQPLDPEEQRRLALYDQEIEQEQYNQALEAWREQERVRRASWEVQHGARLAQARADLEAAAAAVRAREPDLLDADAPTGVRASVRARLQRCDKGA